jgi:hypothetical protein
MSEIETVLCMSSPLFETIWSRKWEMVVAVLDHGIDPNEMYYTRMQHWPLLHEAIARGAPVEVVHKFYAKGYTRSSKSQVIQKAKIHQRDDLIQWLETI